jgi:hypothetical protein
MSRQRAGGVALAALLICSLAVVLRSSGAWQGGAAGKAKIGHPLGHAFSNQDRAKIKAMALAHVAPKKGQQVRVLSVSSHAVRSKGPDTKNLEKHVAHALLFNYSTGKAIRVEVDPRTGKVSHQEEVKGGLGPSAEERAEGSSLVKSDPRLAKLVKGGSHVVGGFIVQAPKGLAATPVPHRYMEFHVVSPDHKKTQQEIIVDLSAKKVVSVRAP